MMYSFTIHSSILYFFSWSVKFFNAYHKNGLACPHPKNLL